MKSRSINENMADYAATCQKNVTKTVTRRGLSDERGFSVTEILVVCVVLLVVSTLAVPSLQKALLAGESGHVYATMRTIQTMQATHYTQNGRFARLSELNTESGDTLLTNSGGQLIRAKFAFATVPPSPSDAQLRNGYQIRATRTVDGVLYSYVLTQSHLVQVDW